MLRTLRILPLAGAFLTLFGDLAAQATPAPSADPADIASIDAIIGAVYESISGPAGQPRDWDRFRSLFVSEARLIPSRVTPGGEGTFDQLVTSVDGYISRFGPGLERSGFFEREIHRVEERYGPVAHVFSTYESRSRQEGPPFARGINSFQLFFDGSRWWVVDVYWFGETADHPIPDRYLPGDGRRVERGGR